MNVTVNPSESLALYLLTSSVSDKPIPASWCLAYLTGLWFNVMKIRCAVNSGYMYVH